MKPLHFLSVLDLFLPRICPGCGQDLSRGEKELCIRCLSSLPETDFFFKKNNPIRQKFTGRFPFDQAVAFYYFQKSSIVQNIIHQFKYKNKKQVAIFMGTQMGHLWKNVPIFRKPDGIVPVPLHRAKEKDRGYNQSKLLGDGMASVLDIPVFPHLLIRTSQTRTQTKLNAVQRWQNVKDAFAINRKKIPNASHLLLIDDVITSGATMEACGRTLSHLNGRKISAAALATAKS